MRLEFESLIVIDSSELGTSYAYRLIRITKA